MRNNILKKLSIVLSSTAVLLMCTSGRVAAQSHGSQSIYLPDPTPRPPDLHREYSDDPVQRERQQQLARLRNAQLLQQVVLSTNSLSLLAQQLKDEVATHDKAAPMSQEAMKAEEIEKLAKRVKEAMKSH